MKTALRTTLTAIAATAVANLATLPANAETPGQAAVTVNRSYDWQPIDGGQTYSCTDTYYFFDRDGDGAMDDMYISLDSPGHGAGRDLYVSHDACRDWPLEKNPYVLNPKLQDYTKEAYDGMLQKLEREYKKQETEHRAAVIDTISSLDSRAGIAAYDSLGNPIDLQIIRCNPDRHTSELRGLEYRTQAAKAAAEARNSARK
jgi:hypothetical protein